VILLLETCLFLVLKQQLGLLCPYNFNLSLSSFSLLLFRADLRKLLSKCKLFFLHHLLDYFVVHIVYFRQKLATKYPHILVHGYPYLPTYHEYHLVHRQVRCILVVPYNN
jgi:hypothetical protein